MLMKRNDSHKRIWSKQDREPKTGEVVIVEDKNHPRNSRRLGIITNLRRDLDGIIRTATVKMGKNQQNIVDRPINVLYPLEIRCEMYNVNKANLEAPGASRAENVIKRNGRSIMDKRQKFNKCTKQDKTIHREGTWPWPECQNPPTADLERQ